MRLERGTFLKSTRIGLAAVLAAIGTLACGMRGEARVDAAVLARGSAAPVLHVTILGGSRDARVPEAREALAHWNREFARLGLRVRVDSGALSSFPVPEEALRRASNGKMKLWSPITDARLLAELSDVPGDIVVALSRADLISFSVPWTSHHKGVVGVRRSDLLPLSLPNTTRNVIAHELGHVFGLAHNSDATTLMCGRPAPCRPAVFASDSAYFFPLTTMDEAALRRRWP